MNTPKTLDNPEVIVTVEFDRYGTTNFAIEASDIPIPPGQRWPRHISVIDARGSRRLFTQGKSMISERGDDVTFDGYIYRTDDRWFSLTVFND